LGGLRIVVALVAPTTATATTTAGVAAPAAIAAAATERAAKLRLTEGEGFADQFLELGLLGGREYADQFCLGFLAGLGDFFLEGLLDLLLLGLDLCFCSSVTPSVSPSEPLVSARSTLPRSCDCTSI
jgi:hypothetical protein